MKNSKKYSPKIRSLFRSLKRKYPKVSKIDFEDPADALVRGILSEHLPLSAVNSMEKNLKNHFVDLNDLRVSRNEEMLEVLGNSNREIEKVVFVLAKVLQSVFDTFNSMSLVRLCEIGKRPAKKKLEELDGISKFVVNYCFMTALDGHAIPLTKKMIEYLRKNELVNPNADDDDIEGFLERKITSANGYEFYWLLKRQSEAGGKTTKKLSSKKTATKKKTKKSTKKTAVKKTKKSVKKKQAGKKTKKSTKKTKKS